MGFFDRLRLAARVGAAATFINNHLQVEVAVGALPGAVTKALAEELVMTFIAQVPALADGSAKPRPALLAAASLAKGVRDADRMGKQAMGTMLFRVLQALLERDVHPYVDVGALPGIDGQLLDLAYAVIESAGPPAARFTLPNEGDHAGA